MADGMKLYLSVTNATIASMKAEVDKRLRELAAGIMEG